MRWLTEIGRNAFERPTAARIGNLSMRGHLRAWFKLGHPDRRNLLVFMVGLPLVAALLRSFGVARSQRWLARLGGSAAPRKAGADALRAAQRLAQLAAIAGRRGVIQAHCLPQSLLLHTLLRRRGLDPLVKMGVRTQGGRVEAHAWVVLEGVALGQGPAGFQPFEPRDSLPAG